MKKNLHLIYLIGISIIIFGGLLAVGKGFDIVGAIKTTPGTLFYIVMLISTFVVMYFSRENKGNQSIEKFYFEKFEVEKPLIENYLSELIHTDDEKVKITYKIIDKTIVVNLSIKKLQDVKVAELISELKTKVETGLEDKFEIKKEFELKFNVQENKEKG